MRKFSWWPISVTDRIQFKVEFFNRFRRKFSVSSLLFFFDNSIKIVQVVPSQIFIAEQKKKWFHRNRLICLLVFLFHCERKLMNEPLNNTSSIESERNELKRKKLVPETILKHSKRKNRQQIRTITDINLVLAVSPFYLWYFAFWVFVFDVTLRKIDFTLISFDRWIFLLDEQRQSRSLRHHLSMKVYRHWEIYLE